MRMIPAVSKLVQGFPWTIISPKQMIDLKGMIVLEKMIGLWLVNVTKNMIVSEPRLLICVKVRVYWTYACI